MSDTDFNLNFQESVQLYAVSDPSTENVYVQEADGGSYKGKKQPSKRGKHEVLVYNLPNTQKSYAFAFVRKNAGYDSYKCIQCQKSGQWRSIKVRGEEFLSNPSHIQHACDTKNKAEEIATRIAYGKVQELKSDAESAGKKPLREWMKIINSKDCLEEEDQPLWCEVQSELHGHGYNQRRKAFSVAINLHRDKTVTMSNVPDHVTALPDGTSFLHEKGGEFHVYYSEDTIKKACQIGLHALVADGMFSLHPKELGRQAQLYCVHAVCTGGVEVPILFAITQKRTVKEYRIIFNHIKEQFCKYEGGDILPKKFILDFERAAIKAATTTFPHAKVEGCAFHLAQAWNRRRDKLGLRAYIDGEKKDERVKKWWHIIKGSVFVSCRLRREVRALHTPPVEEQHEAYNKCLDFLNYLRQTWLSGAYKDLWSKWGVDELRTTNLAEAFNSKLGVLFDSDHPPLKELIEGLKSINTVANCSLRYHEKHPGEGKRLRARDRERREIICELMMDFEQRFRNGVSTREIEDYCQKMSRFVTEKST
ncbi:unnamed protein product [Cylicocyclus nassatus]|uniref:MULE transposase domain-containing protein n=1 Tax=Cylicocyclus nassatus TaxID=53992 RepID=A0AA36GHZ0_CYLNA|nr:unnamed protein product [Cylicocyclus nassatus]